MGHRTQALKREAAHDVGTLWTMQCDGVLARCALLALPRGWEIRVIVDGAIMRTERCDRSAEAFSIAERWKSQLGRKRWQQIVPVRRNGTRGWP